VWVTFCSFFSWASRELHIANVMKDVPAPRFKVAPVEPFNQADVQQTVLEQAELIAKDWAG
jgi:hypothetical protein